MERFFADEAIDLLPNRVALAVISGVSGTVTNAETISPAVTPSQTITGAAGTTVGVQTTTVTING